MTTKAKTPSSAIISQSTITRLYTSVKESVAHLLFPHVCEGCGTDVIQANHFLCLRCHADLPQTLFHFFPNNPIEKIFWGRLPVTYATAQYYFTKHSKMQTLMHEFKYKGNKELGLYLGRLMGEALKNSNRFSFVDGLIPLPLFSTREEKRGYNQAAILCQGIAEIMDKPILHDVISRSSYTDSQTKKTRVQRWANIKERFELIKPEAIEKKHVLLVDDVITTGATLEACGKELMKGINTQLSIATLCFSSR